MLDTVEMGVLLLAFAVATAAIFHAKRRSTFGGFLLGLLLPAIGLFLAIGLPMGGRRCRSCKENVHPKASVCPWCGREIPTSSPAAAREERRRLSPEWVVAILVLGAILGAYWFYVPIRDLMPGPIDVAAPPAGEAGAGRGAP